MFQALFQALASIVELVAEGADILPSRDPAIVLLVDLNLFGCALECSELHFEFKFTIY